MALDGESMSDLESVGECDHPYEEYPFEAYDLGHAQYLEMLAVLHAEQPYNFERGLLPETVDDDYYNNMYCISWFYEGHYPFDTWEENYDQWLYDQILFEMLEE